MEVVVRTAVVGRLLLIATGSLHSSLLTMNSLDCLPFVVSSLSLSIYIKFFIWTAPDSGCVYIRNKFSCTHDACDLDIHNYKGKYFIKISK